MRRLPVVIYCIRFAGLLLIFCQFQLLANSWQTVLTIRITRHNSPPSHRFTLGQGFLTLDSRKHHAEPVPLPPASIYSLFHLNLFSFYTGIAI